MIDGTTRLLFSVLFVVVAGAWAFEWQQTIRAVKAIEFERRLLAFMEAVGRSIDALEDYGRKIALLGVAMSSFRSSIFGGIPVEGKIERKIEFDFSKITGS